MIGAFLLRQPTQTALTPGHGDTRRPVLRHPRVMLAAARHALAFVKITWRFRFFLVTQPWTSYWPASWSMACSPHMSPRRRSASAKRHTKSWNVYRLTLRQGSLWRRKIKVVRVGVAAQVPEHLRPYTLDAIARSRVDAAFQKASVTHSKVEGTRKELRKKHEEYALNEAEVVCGTLSAMGSKVVASSQIAFEVVIVDEVRLLCRSLLPLTPARQLRPWSSPRLSRYATAARRACSSVRLSRLVSTTLNIARGPEATARHSHLHAGVQVQVRAVAHGASLAGRVPVGHARCAVPHAPRRTCTHPLIFFSHRL